MSDRNTGIGDDGETSKFKYNIFETAPEDFKTYNEFVAAKIKELPDHLIMMLPSEGGEETLQVVQILWINDFWQSRKNLVT